MSTKVEPLFRSALNPSLLNGFFTRAHIWKETILLKATLLSTNRHIFATNLNFEPIHFHKLIDLLILKPKQ